MTLRIQQYCRFAKLCVLILVGTQRLFEKFVQGRRLRKGPLYSILALLLSSCQKLALKISWMDPFFAMNVTNNSLTQMLHLMCLLFSLCLCTNYGQTVFFQKSQTFVLGQIFWSEILWGIWGIFGWTTSYREQRCGTSRSRLAQDDNYQFWVEWCYLDLWVCYRGWRSLCQF